MNIAIIGFGKMGKIIAEIAISRGHKIYSVDPFNPNSNFKNISELQNLEIQAAIEFSTPTAVIENINELAKLKIPAIIGTTGWYEQIEQVKNLINQSHSSLLFASNFSIGVNVFAQIIKAASRIFNKIESYDVSMIEFHHNQKADSPSGTALTLAEIILKEIQRKTEIKDDVATEVIKPEQLHLASIRSGNFPGTHEILFDSSADTISLKHTARSRDGFALGAVLAAEWLAKEPRLGVFTITDFMQDLI